MHSLGIEDSLSNKYCSQLESSTLLLIGQLHNNMDLAFIFLASRTIYGVYGVDLIT